MKGSWRAVEAWHCERPGKYTGECAVSVVVKGVMKISWGLALWREPMRGYWWSLVVVEDPSVLVLMPVPWDDHQEGQQHCSEVNHSPECYRGQSWSDDPSPLEEPKCMTMSASQTLKQEAVKLRLLWQPWDVRCARAMGYLLRKAANREWNQPERRNCIAANKAERSWTSDMEMQSLEFAQLFFGLASSICWPWHFGMIMYILCYGLLKAYDLVFYFNFIGDYS